MTCTGCRTTRTGRHPSACLRWHRWSAVRDDVNVRHGRLHVAPCRGIEPRWQVLEARLIPDRPTGWERGHCKPAARAAPLVFRLPARNAGQPWGETRQPVCISLGCRESDASSSVACIYAGDALPAFVAVPIDVDSGVLGHVCVPRWAVCLHRARASSGVRGLRDHLSVKWVYARSSAAKVVQDHTLRNRAADNPMSEPMRVDVLLVASKDAVAPVVSGLTGAGVR